MRTRFLAVAALSAALGVSLVLVAGAGARANGSRSLAATLTGKADGALASNRGHVELKLTAATGRVCWKFKITRIDGAPNAAHIHKGGKSVSNGPVVIPLGGAFKAKGCTTASKTMVKAILAKPRAYYVNVHNVKYPAGAMRGQLTHG